MKCPRGRHTHTPIHPIHFQIKAKKRSSRLFEIKLTTQQENVWEKKWVNLDHFCQYFFNKFGVLRSLANSWVWVCTRRSKCIAHKFIASNAQWVLLYRKRYESHNANVKITKEAFANYGMCVTYNNKNKKTPNCLPAKRNNLCDCSSHSSYRYFDSSRNVISNYNFFPSFIKLVLLRNIIFVARAIAVASRSFVRSGIHFGVLSLNVSWKPLKIWLSWFFGILFLLLISSEIVFN